MMPNVTLDKISVLPDNIKDSILTRLEIKEAARTCVLSRSWRYQWHFLSKIRINYNDFYGVSEAETVKIIDNILLFHRGSVDKLDLASKLKTHNDIDRWVLYVSRNGIKELAISNSPGHKYNIPSCLFSCSGLTSLDLVNCIFEPPSAFKAFCNLTNLGLFDVIIDSKALENVIKSCPLLSQLNLDGCELQSPLKIYAPKLVILRIVGLEHFPQLMNTPLLHSVYFELECREASGNENYIVEFLGSMPILQRLELECDTLQHLADGDVPACLPSVCPIKHLVMSIRFDDLREMLLAFCIFRSSPFIRHLQIGVSSNKDGSRISADGFWKGGHDFGFKFDHLQTVEVYWLTGTECELKFIEFLLSKAPALKTMEIQFPCKTEDKSTIVRELIRFPRISPNAQLILHPDWNQGPKCRCCP